MEGGREGKELQLCAKSSTKWKGSTFQTKYKSARQIECLGSRLETFHWTPVLMSQLPMNTFQRHWAHLIIMGFLWRSDSSSFFFLSSRLLSLLKFLSYTTKQFLIPMAEEGGIRRLQEVEQWIKEICLVISHISFGPGFSFFFCSGERKTCVSLELYLM